MKQGDRRVVHISEGGRYKGGRFVAFTLATLNFGGLAAGSSMLDFSYAALSDEDANCLADFTTAGSRDAPASVPDTGPMWVLFGVACVALFSFRKVAA